VLGALAAGGEEAGDGVEALAQALRVAEATGVRAPLDAHGDALRGLLARHLAALGPGPTTPPGPAGAAGPGGGAGGTGPGPGGSGGRGAIGSGGPAGAGNGPVVVDPLSARELDVLRQLPTLMSNAEIAGHLHLSVNTVKTHLKAVYRKLGATGRRQAVVRARDLGLL
jgi:DNA-binding CsgD family transcriptional regulator